MALQFKSLSQKTVIPDQKVASPAKRALNFDTKIKNISGGSTLSNLTPGSNNNRSRKKSSPGLIPVSQETPKQEFI